MTIDVGLGFVSNEAAYRRARTVAPWLAVAAVFVAAVLLRQVMPLNVDVSWGLIESERMLDGQRLYVDMLETNPPTALSVYWLGVALARATGVRPEVMTDGLIFVLIAASLALTWRILQYSSLRGRVAGGALAVWAAVLLCVLPMYDFGQREHLAVLAMLPAIAVYILRGNREVVTPAAVLIAALGAAITLSFKPYFVFAVGFCILATAAQARDWRVVFAPENWIAAALVVVYAICIFLHLRFLSRVFYDHLSFGARRLFAAESTDPGTLRYFCNCAMGRRRHDCPCSAKPATETRCRLFRAAGWVIRFRDLVFRAAQGMGLSCLSHGCARSTGGWLCYLGHRQ